MHLTKRSRRSVQRTTGGMTVQLISWLRRVIRAIGAVAEYPDPAHPVRRTIADYRRWAHGLFRAFLTAAGHPDADHTATILMMMRGGIVVGSDLDDPKAMRPAIPAAIIRQLAPG